MRTNGGAKGSSVSLSRMTFINALTPPPSRSDNRATST
jgi:hypothetical protein